MTEQFSKSMPFWFDPLCNSIDVNDYRSNLRSANCMTSQTFYNCDLDLNNATFPYFHILTSDIDIFREISIDINSIENTDVKQRTLDFISSFQQIIINNRAFLEASGQLPPLKLNIPNDQSVVIEWVFSNFRIGFCIEVEARESSWYIVSNKMLNEESYSNYLDSSKADTVIYNILNYVLINK